MDVSTDYNSKTRINICLLFVNIAVCPTNLDRPEHGLVTVSNNVATYTCFENYKIQGTETRQCSKGIWEGHPPQCVLGTRLILGN